MKKKIHMRGKSWVTHTVYSYDKFISKHITKASIHLKIYGEILIGIKIIASINLIL